MDAEDKRFKYVKLFTTTITGLIVFFFGERLLLQNQTRNQTIESLTTICNMPDEEDKVNLLYYYSSLIPKDEGLKTLAKKSQQNFESRQKAIDNQLKIDSLNTALSQRGQEIAELESDLEKAQTPNQKKEIESKINHLVKEETEIVEAVQSKSTELKTINQRLIKTVNKGFVEDLQARSMATNANGIINEKNITKRVITDKYSLYGLKDGSIIHEKNGGKRTTIRPFNQAVTIVMLESVSNRYIVASSAVENRVIIYDLLRGVMVKDQKFDVRKEGFIRTIVVDQTRKSIVLKLKGPKKKVEYRLSSFLRFK